MDFTLGLVIGVIVGLLASWVVQPLAGFRRSGGDIAGLNDTLADISVRLATLENATTAQNAQVITVNDADAVTRVFVEDQDPLEEITGIGPVIAARFNASGIYTFAELAEMTPARAAEIAAVEEWQKIEPETWIQQARSIIGNRSASAST